MEREQRLHELAIRMSERIDALRPQSAAQESLRAAFRAFAETLPHIVWTANAAGDMTFFNQRFYDFTGVTSCDPDDVVHPDDQDAARAAWRGAVAAGKDHWNSCRVRGADGQYYRCVTRAHAVREHDGRVSYWIGSTAIDSEVAMLRKVA